MRSASRITVKRNVVAGYTAIPPAGGLSTADAAYIHGWNNTQQAWMTARLSTLTGFSFWKAGDTFAGAAGNGIETSLEGGAVGPPNSAFMQLSSSTVWQAPKTSGFAMVVRGKFSAVSGNTQMIGAVNLAGSVWVAIALGTAFDATKLVIRFQTAGTDVALTVADTSIHDYGIVFVPSGTPTVSVYQDQVLIGSATTLTNFSNVAMAPQMFNIGGGDTKATQAAWGYVAV